MASSSRTPREYGQTHVVRPKGNHQATIVWLHDIGSSGSTCSNMLERLSSRNIKWICPTAPTRPVTLHGGYLSRAWFDVGKFVDDLPDDFEGLDSSAVLIANLLSNEPNNVKLGIGGFSMGAAMALYSATCFAQGKFSNGYSYPVNLSVIISLSGWLPGYKNIRKNIEGSHDAVRRAESLSILICYGNDDEVVPSTQGEIAIQALSSSGFTSILTKIYDGVGHYTLSNQLKDVCQWVTERLRLEGSGKRI